MARPNTTYSPQSPQHCMHVAAYYGLGAEALARLGGGWMNQLIPADGYKFVGGEKWVVGNLNAAIDQAKKCAREMCAAGLITDRTNRGTA